MMRLLALALILFVPQDEKPLDAVKKAVEKTAGDTYYYKVAGKYDRTGEWKPAAILTARIRSYQSARNGDAILVKGPEGLWKSPEERLGEQTENPDKDAVEIVTTLKDAEAPHSMLVDLLPILEGGRKADDKEIDGTPCHAYTFKMNQALLKTSIETQMKKALEAKAMEKPDEVRWSTLKGSVRVYVSKKEGRLVKVFDERSVSIAYKQSGAADVKRYKNEFEYEFSGWGKASITLPKEVKEQLKIED